LSRGAGAEIEVVLERHADQAGDRILELLRDVGVAAGRVRAHMRVLRLGQLGEAGEEAENDKSQEGEASRGAPLHAVCAACGSTAVTKFGWRRMPFSRATEAPPHPTIAEALGDALGLRFQLRTPSGPAPIGENPD